ncbi:hypothetical protein [Oceanospirillum beijerinckii]|uniref:hypothetical protein n=1 Tax=Oceanospirillum beijerinckii TaxID=64976 RepID=UPI0004895A9A|nr:hypothetical protein [Oceanospirillum beijerinckii]
MMVKALVVRGLIFLGRVLLRAAMDKQLRTAVVNAVQTAEKSDLKGSAKMAKALELVKQTGGKALVRETESTLRTKLEQAIDHLGL